MQLIHNIELSAVTALLTAADLPIEDLSQAKLKHFIGITSNDTLCGIIGLELFTPVALLRSLVVTDSVRGTGLGQTLVKEIETYAAKKNIEEIYLLTTTAEDFFVKLGYQTIERASAPETIRNTEEFSSICPGSATVMNKSIT